MNEPIKTEDTDIMSIYQKSDNILSDIQNIIETSQRQAYSHPPGLLWLRPDPFPLHRLRGGHGYGPPAVQRRTGYHAGLCGLAQARYYHRHELHRLVGGRQALPLSPLAL